MVSKFNKELNQIENEVEELFDAVQELAMFSLKEAQRGEIKYSNDLIYAFRDTVFVEIKLLIGWFEKFGKLKWSNKKGELVFSDSGRWQIVAAEKNHWQDTKNTKAQAQQTRRKTKITGSLSPTGQNFDRLLYGGLLSNPIKTQEGKFGLPAGKNRWGKYKLKIKRK